MKRFEDYNIRVTKDSGREKTLCPKCSHTRKKKNDPCLLVNHDKKYFKCYNCDWWGYLNQTFEKNRVIEEPKTNPKKEGFYKWFFDRGISKETLDRLQVDLISNKIAFKYYKGVDLVNIKYRTKDKKFSQTKDGQSCFYNLNTIKASDYVIITEGEIDTLSYEEVGLRSISVPAGGGKKNLDFIDNSAQYLKSIERFYLSLDNDDKGHEMREELVRRLGKAKCYLIDLGDYKDANEYIVHEGRDALKERFEKAESYPIKSVINPIKLKDDFKKYLKEGVKRNPISKLIDNNIVNLESQLVIVTGIPSHGKTTFMLNYLVRIAIYSGWKSAIFSPEHSEVSLMKKIGFIYTGKSTKSNNHPFTDQEFNLSMEFMTNNFVFINAETKEYKLNEIIESIEYAILSKGVKSILIDSYMKLQTEILHGSETLTIQSILNKLSKLCKDYNVTIFLIAHPKKMTKNESGRYEVPSLYDISGSKSFNDIADVGITVYRKIKDNESSSEIHITKVRDEGDTGMIGKINNLVFNTLNHRFEIEEYSYDLLTK